jgi:hypothetical protein
MSESFTVSQSRFASADPSVRSEILVRTGNEAATSGIMRSIERFGGDPSIIRYEVSPQARARFGGPAGKVSWSVRAVRS